jgi:hypothetical protein
MLQYLCLEYNKIVTSTNITQNDREKIRTYIVYRIFSIYNFINEIDKNNRIVGAKFKADAMSVLSQYIEIHNPSNKMAILKYRQDAALYMNKEEDNPYIYSNHLRNYIFYLQDFGYFSQARKLIDAVSLNCINKPDYNLIGNISYPLFRNYFLQKDYAGADTVTNWTYNLAFDTTIKIDKSQFGTSYNQQKYDWAVLRKDTITMERFKPYINNNYIPIDEFAEIVNIEANVKAEKLRQLNDSLTIANKKLIETNKDLKQAIKLAEANEKEAKRQKDNAVAQKKLAEKRLDTIIEKDSTIQKQLVQLKNDSIRLENEIVLKDIANAQLDRAKKDAESKTKIANRNKLIAYILGGIAGILFLAAGILAVLYYFKNKKLKAKNKELEDVTLKKLEIEIANKKLENEKQQALTKALQAENDRQKAEANLAHKLLTIHNFKGLETAKDDLYFHNNIETDPIIEKCYNVLNSTFLYTQKLLVNLEKSVVSLEDEFEAIKHYFTILKISKNKLYNLVLPEQTELLQYNDFKMIANIIQPIIENIIDYSGIEKCGNNGEDGLIKINILKQDKNLIKININDNGCGNTNDDRKNAKKSTGLSLKLLSELILKYTDNNKNIMIFDIDNDLQIQNGNTNINLKLLKYD